MRTQSSPVTSKPLACVSSLWARCLLTLLLAAFGTVVFPANSRATMSFLLGTCQQNSIQCQTTVNAATTNTGTTVIGDTNPPPVYNVFATSDGVISLHWSGSTIDTGGGPTSGFTLLTLTPQSGFSWGAIDFTLDSTLGLPNQTCPPSCNLTLTALDQFGQLFSQAMPFPWENNTGDNQQYTVLASNGEVIKSLTLNYSNSLGDLIHDIHNIDVNTQVPEPSSFLLVGLSLLVIRPFLRRYL